DVTVSFSAADVEAANGGVDYNLPPGTLTFSPGVLSQPINFTLNDDGDIEGNETFRVDLGSPSLNATLFGGTQQHVHTIVDDEGPPQIGFLQANSNSPESIGSHAIQVQLSAPT